MKKSKVTTRIVKDIDMKKLDDIRKNLIGDKEVKVGFPEGSAAEDGTPMAMIAATHEFGSPERGIPERSFLRTGIVENKEQFARLNRINLVKIINGQMDVGQALGQLGLFAQGKVQQRIRNGSYAPLSEATIKRKGSSKPLIDTGQMVKSVTFVVGDKEK